MDTQWIQAYVTLIEQLLSCSSARGRASVIYEDCWNQGPDVA